ncbi:MAG: flagellar basal body P-ring protein FlgI [Gemmatimonadaceae bacterium]
MIKALLLATLASLPLTLGAQDVAVRELTSNEGAGPVRLMGYGLVTGLSGTGDRAAGTYGSRQTVQSIVNLLRNFEVEVPAHLLRTRNVAAVVVTAEVSSYLRPGGRFDVHVSSVGDARSLHGGVLWMTPLVGDIGGRSLAAAQGALLVTEATSDGYARARSATSGRVPDGGVLEANLPRAALGATARLLLRDPDLGTAHRIVAAIKAELGDSADARVEDPGAIVITAREGAAELGPLLARVAEVRVRAAPVTQLLIDARDGTIVAGADLTLGDGLVSVEGLTLMIGAAPADSSSRAAPGRTTVRDVASVLQAAQASASQVAAVFLALRDAGALRAGVEVR